MEINGLAVTVINEDKLISTQIINASQAMKAAFFLRVCACSNTECPDKDREERKFHKCSEILLVFIIVTGYFTVSYIEFR